MAYTKVTGALVGSLSDLDLTNVGDIQLDSITGDGDTNTSITFSGSDVITIATGGTTALTVDANQKLTANSGVAIDNITIDGTEIDLSSGDLTLDVAGDITLDADGGDWVFSDGGTTIFGVHNVSSDAVLKANVNDKDMIFKGTDNNSEITALTLDMSDAGTATFNNTIKVSVDSDVVAEIGRAHVGGGITGLSDYAIFSHLHASDSGGYALAQNASGATFLNADDGQDIKFLAHGTTKMTMASDGNVGIGTTSPDYNLEVEFAASNHTTGATITNSQAGGYGSALNFVSERSDNNAHTIAARIRTEGADSWNTDASTDSNLKFETVSANSVSTNMTIMHDGKVGIGASSPTGKLEIQNAQVTTQYDRDSFLRLHPSAHTNSGGFTNIFFGTSTTNNYGVALGGVRAGTNDAPEFSIRLLNDSISGVEMLNIDTNGSIKSKSGGMVLQTKEVYANTSTGISSGSSAVICSTTITVQEGSKLAVWGHSGQIQNDGNGQNPNMLIQWVSADGNTTTNISDHNGNHYGWDASTHVERMFITSQGISGTLSAATYTVRLLGGAYNGSVTMNYQDQGSHMIIQEISAN
tara:strand:+ start:276 stop:2024 length:1749 start_codon:yes stop_codon:yes gene_type:complete